MANADIENTLYEYVEFRTHMKEAIANFKWDEDISEENRFKVVIMSCLSLSQSAHNWLTEQNLSVAEFAEYMSKEMRQDQ